MAVSAQQIPSMHTYMDRCESAGLKKLVNLPLGAQIFSSTLQLELEDAAISGS